MTDNPFPWYETITGRDLDQGDILRDCPVLAVKTPEDLYAAQTANRKRSQPLLQVSLGQLSLSGSSHSKRVEQREQLVHLCILACHNRNRSM